MVSSGLTGSVTAYLAESSIARGDRTNFLRYLLATIILGTTFVAGVGVEWTTAEFELSEPFSTAFFSMTSLRAGHVVSGIVMLASLWAW